MNTFVVKGIPSVPAVPAVEGRVTLYLSVSEARRLHDCCSPSYPELRYTLGLALAKC